MLTCVGLIIYFGRAGRKGTPKTPRPSRGKKIEDTPAEKDASVAEPSEAPEVTGFGDKDE
jgi:hypothetical protein